MNDKLMYIPNDDKQDYPLKLLVEKFETYNSIKIRTVFDQKKKIS